VINEPARRVLPRLAPGIEFAFIDAIKTEYSAYLDALLPKMAPGGVITVDNLTWSGRIAAGEHDENTDALRAFNDKFLHHEQLEATILPVGDGVGLGAVRPHGSPCRAEDIVGCRTPTLAYSGGRESTHSAL